eukprot:3940639-Prymnesium_polylepis.2
MALPGHEHGCGPKGLATVSIVQGSSGLLRGGYARVIDAGLQDRSREEHHCSPSPHAKSQPSSLATRPPAERMQNGASLSALCVLWQR